MNTRLQEEKEEELPDPPLGRIMKMNAPEWFFILLGCFGALINGGIQPAFAMIFADIIGVSIKITIMDFKNLAIFSDVSFAVGLRI